MPIASEKKICGICNAAVTLEAKFTIIVYYTRVHVERAYGVPLNNRSSPLLRYMYKEVENSTKKLNPAAPFLHYYTTVHYTIALLGLSWKDLLN